MDQVGIKYSPEEVKSQKLQLELSVLRQEADRRVHEKEEEFENTRWLKFKSFV